MPAVLPATMLCVVLCVASALQWRQASAVAPRGDDDDGRASREFQRHFHAIHRRQSGRSACFHRDAGLPGRCVSLPLCARAVEERRRGGHPQSCGFPTSASRIPDVCCPLVEGAGEGPPMNQALQSGTSPPLSMTCKTFNKTFASVSEDPGSQGATSRRMCREYQRQICAGEINLYPSTTSAGYGFAPADLLEFPHMALLGTGEKDKVSYFCGGSLISQFFILTAAHCQTSQSGARIRWVLLGVLNRTSSGTRDPASRQLLEAAEVVVHPEYAPPAQYHDVALVRLAGDGARLAEGGVRPACLHTDLDDYDGLQGRTAVVSGWGAQIFDGDPSEALLKGDVRVRPLSDCAASAAKIRLPRGLDERSHLCAGGDGKGVDTDACSGDSGGPLQLPVLAEAPDCLHRVAGIVSFGPPCGILGQPGVYTRVATYAPWIERIVWPQQQQEQQEQQGEGECPLPDTGPGTVARRACNRYMNDYCSQDVNLFVRRPLVGLSKATQCHYRDEPPFQELAFTEFPHQIELVYGEFPHKEQGCAGALISADFVLTAAHCARQGCRSVREAHFTFLSRRGFYSEYSEVQEVIEHPDYDAARRTNDIALVRLARPVRMFHIALRPACLDTGDVDIPKTAIGTGLSATGEWANVYGALRKASLSTQNASACAASLRRLKQAVGNKQQQKQPSFEVEADTDTDTQMCTSGTAVFPGDSGGPLQTLHTQITALNWSAYDRLQQKTVPLDEANVYRVIGVLSSPSPCGSGQPDVYTKVSAFVPWIESIVWPAASQQQQ